MRALIATASLLALLAPVAVHATYWEPGIGTAQDVYQYTICDTIRQVCYDADLELLVPVLHGQSPYWVVRADMTVLAGFPPGMEYPRGFVAEPWSITGEPSHDMELLADSMPPGIPSSTYVLLYNGKMHSPFVDQSRMLVDSLDDTIFGINELMDGTGLVHIGERWGDMVVTGSADGLYIIEYAGEGSATFLIDPVRPMPLAGIYKADRYDPHVSDTMWFHAGAEYMDTLLGMSKTESIDVSGPDDVMRAGTLAGLSWSSDTYQITSLTTAPDRAVIRGHASGPGALHIVMPAFGSQYTFWQDGVAIPAEYGVAGGVLSALIQHGDGDITIHSIPDATCTGNCLKDLIVRAWDGPAAIVYGNGFHGSVRMSLAAGDPNGIAPSLCPPGSSVTVDFDIMEPRPARLTLPYTTTYESNLEVSMSREGSMITAEASGQSGALTLRMPAMLGDIVYTSNGSAVEPLAESVWHDTISATLEHAGGTAVYVVEAGGQTAWRSGLAIPPPAAATGAVWCGMAEPVNSAVIRDGGVSRQDCGVTKFDGGWNVWC